MANRGTFSFPGKSRSQPYDFQSTGAGLFSQRPPAGFPGRLFYTTDTQKLYIDDGVTWQLPSAPPMLAHSEATVTSVNNTAETDMVNFNVPANSVAAGDVLRLTVYGDGINNSGVGTDNIIWKAYLGATNWATTPNDAHVNNANTWFWRAVCHYQIVTLTTQRGYVELGSTISAATTWSSNNTSTPFISSITTLAIDTTAAFAMRLTATHSLANAATQVRLLGYDLERLVA